MGRPRPYMTHRALDNALAATVLLRTAIAVAEHGVTEGLARCRDQLVAAAARLDDQAAGRASRRVPGLCGLPARPGCYVRDLVRRADPPEPYVRQRLARAREYGLVVLDAVPELLEAGSGLLAPWAGTDLRKWREVVGYTATRPPNTWEQTPVAGQREPLARRLAERPDAVPYAVEEVGDLLWYGELADAVARLHGHEAATVTHYGPGAPDVTIDPAPGEPDPAPLDPRLDSLPLAVAGAAQLVSLGVRAPRRCRTWKELVEGLTGDVDLAQALTGTFQVPEPLTALDGQEIPGTGLRVELARGPRTLAEWSSYMGNCIASPFYVEEATAGKCGLLAMRDRDGHRPGRGHRPPLRPGHRHHDLAARNGPGDRARPHQRAGLPRVRSLRRERPLATARSRPPPNWVPISPLSGTASPPAACGSHPPGSATAAGPPCGTEPPGTPAGPASRPEGQPATGSHHKATMCD
ncbi:MAG TPA: hypothetical protein VM347_21130 [Nonomuraea sp.]|nr:hypothetical protein [Nonomuraea sp.]